MTTYTVEIVASFHARDERDLETQLATVKRQIESQPGAAVMDDRVVNTIPDQED